MVTGGSSCAFWQWSAQTITLTKAGVTGKSSIAASNWMTRYLVLEKVDIAVGIAVDYFDHIQR